MFVCNHNPRTLELRIMNSVNLDYKLRLNLKNKQKDDAVPRASSSMELMSPPNR